MKKKGVVEIFGGIAGLAQGFADTKEFYIQGLIDIDPVAKSTFKLNYPDVKYLQKDIKKISPKEFLDYIGGEKPFGVFGCPPCQGLSTAGKRNSRDPRNRLIYDFFKYVSYIKPKIYILENVPQILLNDNYRRLINDFSENQGYSLWSGILNCALYGLPQTRQRAVVIGVQKSLKINPSPPQPTHYGIKEVYCYPDMKMVSTRDSSSFEKILGWYATIPKADKSKEQFEKMLGLTSLISLEEALGDLPTAIKKKDSYTVLPKTEYQKMMRLESSRLSNHSPWGHSSDMVERIAKTPEGGVNRSKKYFSQAYGRLHRKGLARTITGHFHNAGCGRYIHYKENRTITVREAARLQGFEDRFSFSGKSTDQRRLLGNAFPKTLAKSIANHLINQLV